MAGELPEHPQAPRTPEDAEAPRALAFVHDQPSLVRRFILAELLAPPLALRSLGPRPSSNRAPAKRER
jgi:hypothetical protein